jgi:hypothetical protein
MLRYLLLAANTKKRKMELTLETTLEKLSFIYCTNLILGEVIHSAKSK